MARKRTQLSPTGRKTYLSPSALPPPVPPVVMPSALPRPVPLPVPPAAPLPIRPVPMALPAAPAPSRPTSGMPVLSPALPTVIPQVPGGPLPTAQTQVVPQSVRLLEVGPQAMRELANVIRAGIQSAGRGAGLTPASGLGGGGKGTSPAGGTANQESGPGLLGGLGNVLSAVTGPVGMAVAGFTAAAGATMKFVEAANPGAVERFNIAMKDTVAVVGHALTPVLEILTGVVRLVGDVLASILPSAEEMREILKPVSEALKELREDIKPLIPILRDQLYIGLKMFAEAVKLAMIPMKVMYKLLGGLLGAGEELKSSVGAAARSISFTTQEAFAKSVYQAAFKNTQGAGEAKPTKPITTYLDEIGETLDEIAGFVRGIADFAVNSSPLGMLKNLTGGKEGGIDLGGILKSATPMGGIQGIKKLFGGGEEKDPRVGEALAEALRKHMEQKKAEAGAQRGIDGFGGRL